MYCEECRPVDGELYFIIDVWNKKKIIRHLGIRWRSCYVDEGDWTDGMLIIDSEQLVSVSQQCQQCQCVLS